jgi:hypothetical protein
MRLMVPLPELEGPSMVTIGMGFGATLIQQQAIT